MKHNEQATAGALAILAAVSYLLCAFLVYGAPGAYKAIASTWMHGVNVSRIWANRPPPLATMLVGFLTFTAAAYVAGYCYAAIYNYLLKGKK